MRLLPLDSPLTSLGPFANRIAGKLTRIGLKTIEDLLFYFPYRWEDWSNVVPVKTLVHGMTATVSGRVMSIELKRTPWRKRLLVKARIQDDAGDSVSALWFNSTYLLRALPKGTQVLTAGRVEQTEGGLQFVHPTWEKLTSRAPTHAGRLVPMYHLTGTLTQKQIRALTAMALQSVRNVPDFLPSPIKSLANLISLDTAVRAIHFPNHWAEKNEAEKRLKFDELFLLQLRGVLARQEISAQASSPVPFNESLTRAFVRSLSFKLTQAQRKAAWAILKDLNKPTPMNRLLEGDVGSGKTAVAAIAALNTVHAGFQTAYLAPTAILASQQFETFCQLFSSLPFTIALITQGDIRLKVQSSKFKVQSNENQQPTDTRYQIPDTKPTETVKISKRQLLEFLHKGHIDLAVGTHALLSEHIKFPKLALVIVDEQHRFGVRQRHALLQRNHSTLTDNLQLTTVPHLLSMTATPIPRSLALVAYGDLDVSILDEKPAGRASITTKIIRQEHRKDAYDLIRSEIGNKHQAFIICPLIDPSDTLGVKSVTEEVKRLTTEHFREHKLALLHGRMSPKEKDRIMREFVNGTTHVLVATPVIEVGIDVPNATVILIEGAERFGLAQLHQLRGRVGRRAGLPSWCLLATDSESEGALARLQAVVESNDGFKLAAKDLEMRGPGEVYGTTQAGFLNELKIAKLTDTIILKQSKEAVDRLLAEDHTLERHPAIKLRLARFEHSVHFE